MKLKLTTQFIILAVCFLVPCILHAQLPGFADDVEDVPIDGGLSALIAAGVGYGVKKIRKRKA